jgi:hypothetical protein
MHEIRNYGINKHNNNEDVPQKNLKLSQNSMQSKFLPISTFI